MRAQVGPGSRELKTMKEYESNRYKREDLIVTGFFEKDSDLKGEFFKTADKMREEVTFTHMINRALLEQTEYKYVFISFFFFQVLQILHDIS